MVAVVPVAAEVDSVADEVCELFSSQLFLNPFSKLDKTLLGGGGGGFGGGFGGGGGFRGGRPGGPGGRGQFSSRLVSHLIESNLFN